MIETILIACIVLKIKHYKLRYIFYHWSFYPVLLTQGVLLFLQASIFLQCYQFVSYVSVIQVAVILSFIFPIFSFGLYKPAFWGCGTIVLGTLMNQFVIMQNGGKMPIFPSLSYLTGYVKPDMVTKLDSLHVLGNAATKFKFLTDYIDLGYSILSPGDLLIHFFSFLILYYAVKAVNLRYRQFATQIKY
ncbi:MAG: DUF5317 family protein [Oscillospiraceae bacterium]|mgnify:FL=1|nr:DUF5317 family protein [Oscillospiraceae bacterium]